MNNKKLGGLYGALLGDACGCPYEFKSPDKIPPLEQIEMIPPTGYPRTWKEIKVGTYTDDGAQALILLETLLNPAPNIVAQLRAKLIAWLGAGYKSVDNLTFDVGGQTRTALQLCNTAKDVMERLSGERSSGNGSLMRCIPAALVATSLEHAMILGANQSLATHPNYNCQVSCALYAGIAYLMLHGHDVDGALVQVIERQRQLDPNSIPTLDYIVGYENNEPTGTGFVVDSFWSALYALHVGTTFKEVIKQAIALGNDTDTTACIAGGLAGIKFGYSELPTDWLELLRGKNLIEPLANQLT